MRTVTIADFKNLGRRDVFLDDESAAFYRVYTIRGDGCYLYVGKSKNAIGRMLDHLRPGVQQVDFLIRRATADEYEVDLYTEKDICRDIFERIPGMRVLSEEELGMRVKYMISRHCKSEDDVIFLNTHYIDYSVTSIIMDACVDAFEKSMIWEHSPVFNTIGINPQNKVNDDLWYSIHPDTYFNPSPTAPTPLAGPKIAENAPARTVKSGEAGER